MATWTTTVKDWTAEALTSAALDAQLRDFANAFGAWGSYTPTWGSTGTAPAIGNGSIGGAYLQVQKTVMFRMFMQTGSTSTYGTGAYTISLPVNTLSVVDQLVDMVAFDSSTGLYYRGIGKINSGALQRGYFVDGVASTAGWTPTVPFTWASGDQLWITGTYEAA